MVPWWPAGGTHEARGGEHGRWLSLHARTHAGMAMMVLLLHKVEHMRG
eukprot:COSAG02_NODE_75_length_41389_cov_106.665762_21_plen_48_part_00